MPYLLIGLVIFEANYLRIRKHVSYVASTLQIEAVGVRD